MTRNTIVLGAVLIVLGVVAYLATGRDSVTALIPAFLGVPILVLGLVAREERRRKHAIHAAVVLAALGALGGIQGLPDLPTLLRGDDLDRPGAVATQSVMFVIGGVYVALAVRSFIEARRSEASSSPASE